LPDERPKSLVIVGNHQLDPAQPAVGKAAQEVGRVSDLLCMGYLVHAS